MWENLQVFDGIEAGAEVLLNAYSGVLHFLREIDPVRGS